MSMCADFAPTEAVAMGLALEAIEKPRAKERKQSGLKRGTKARGGKLPEREKADTRDAVGAGVGMSGKTYERAKAVVAGANRRHKACFRFRKRYPQKRGGTYRSFERLDLVR